MSTHKLDKIKSIFTIDQKEKLITQDGKRNLYFDRNRKNFIKFSLDVKTTCSYIQKVHEKEINKMIKEIYGDNAKLDEFAFLIVELMANKFEGKSSYIDLKVGMNDTILFNALQNSQLMLCYLPINIHNIELKKRLKNKIIPITPKEKEKSIQEIEDILNYKGKSEKDIKVYLSKTVIHYYNSNKKSFSKEKIKITEKEIYIFAKQDRFILIKDIREFNKSIIDEEEKYKKMLEKYEINGEKPKYCIEIITIKNEKLLIGRNTYEHFITLNKAIESAIINFQSINANYFLKNKLIGENNDLITNCKKLAQSCFTIDDLVTNEEKRKIFLKDFKEINLGHIVNNIIEYKINFKHKKYIEAINNIKNILEIINEKMEKEELDKNKNIINKDRIEQIENIYNKARDFNKIENNIDWNENMENELGKILNINIFDDLYLDIKSNYLSKYYYENNYNIENKNEKLCNNIKILQNTKLLLGHYFTKIFNINKEENVLFLGDEKVEEITQKFSEQLTQERLVKYYVFGRK